MPPAIGMGSSSSQAETIDLPHAPTSQAPQRIRAPVGRVLDLVA
jgi:hypothetical protein